MPATITNAMDALRTERYTHCVATTWRVTRTDGEVLRMTDHDTPLVLADGFTYSPVGAFSTSAHAAEDGLKVRNIEFFGPLASGYVTQDDLRAGRWTNAEVLEQWVDWRYPWAGYFRQWFYWINRPDYDQERWRADGVGLVYKMTHPAGDVYGRTCRWDLGEAFGESGVPGCKVDVDSVSFFNEAVDEVTDTTILDGEVNTRLRFIWVTNSVGDPDPDFFNAGRVEWQSGANEGLVSEVYTCTENTTSSSRYEFTLTAETPYAITDGDFFHVRPGCLGTTTDCKDKFDNFANFGGFPHMPGTDGILHVTA